MARVDRDAPCTADGIVRDDLLALQTPRPRSEQERRLDTGEWQAIRINQLRKQHPRIGRDYEVNLDPLTRRNRALQLS
jgi:hypothetical protein